jgi:hypothetical protein
VEGEEGREDQCFNERMATLFILSSDVNHPLAPSLNLMYFRIGSSTLKGDGGLTSPCAPSTFFSLLPPSGDPFLDLILNQILEFSHLLFIFNQNKDCRNLNQYR